MSAGELLPSTAEIQEDALSPSQTFKTERVPDTGTVVYAGEALRKYIEADQAWLAEHPKQEQPDEASSAA